MRKVAFIGSAQKDLRRIPDVPRQRFGYALYQAQQGISAKRAKPLQGFGGSSVVELVEDFDGDTYRTVYTTRFAEVLYVLHCFQKKSKKGRKTSKQEIDLVKRRLRDAKSHYTEHFKRKR